MPTAPRRPIQAMNIFSRQGKRNGVRHRNTATGRATSIKVAATASAARMWSMQARRHDQKPEQHEHRDLRQPGDGIEKGDHGVVRPRGAIADHETGEIDGQEA